jgi:hypothetical protein
MKRHMQNSKSADLKAIRLRGIRLIGAAVLMGALPALWLSGNSGKVSEAVAASSAQAGPPSQAATRVRLAEGEYRIYRQATDGGIGPFNPALHDFSESWALWRLPDGNLAIEGARTYEAEYDRHKDGFIVRLSKEFTIQRVIEYKKLRWRPDSGPLTCDFWPDVLDCNSGARDPSQEVRLRLQLKTAYGFLWPISAFSMSNITRFATHTPGTTIPVGMLTIDEVSSSDPVMATVLEGKLRYLGQEQIVVADKKWQADKFELKVALNPRFMIWTSRQGLLLDLTEEDNQHRLTEHGMKLVHYQQFTDY